MAATSKGRALITGGAGFIGSYLCERFLAEGWEVICLDNFFTGSKRNISHLLGRPDFEMVRHDIVFPYFAEVDLVLNFSCPASPVHYQHNAIKTIKTNVIGTLNMLGLAKRVGARFLQASTSEVYGDPLEHPQKEEYWGNVNPIGVRACYDEGKRAAETLCFDYNRGNGVDTRVVRIFNTYGPRMAIDDGRVVSNFVVQALRAEDITIYGDGSQTRSFCYVDDLVDGIYRYSQTDDEPGPINMGNNREFKISDLAAEIVRQVGGKCHVIHKDLPEDDPRCRQPDISRAQKLLGWNPTTPLREGLAQTISYFRAALGL